MGNRGAPPMQCQQLHNDSCRLITGSFIDKGGPRPAPAETSARRNRCDSRRDLRAEFRSFHLVVRSSRPISQNPRSLPLWSVGHPQICNINIIQCNFKKPLKLACTSFCACITIFINDVLIIVVTFNIYNHKFKIFIKFI